MKIRLLYFLLFILLAGACKRTDFDEIRRTQEQQKEQLDEHAKRLAALENAVKGITSDVTSLKAITDALQKNVSIRSYQATTNGYILTMSDGSTINLLNGKDGQNGTNGTNGKDGLNAPLIGVKADTDGQYYWTLGGEFIIQNGQKLRVVGKDGSNGQNGTDGKNGVTPLFQISADNYWMASYDSGNNWSYIMDKNGNRILATGPAGVTGPQGPSGIPGFTISSDDNYVSIVYQGSTYLLPRARWQISAGGAHTFLLSPNGILYGMGFNGYGQLGIGDNNDRTSPVFVMSGIKAVSGGDSYTMVLKDNGTVWTTGYNYNGQLGNGTFSNNRNTFIQVADNVISLSAIATGSSSFIIKADGTLWGTGQNQFGQLGLGDQQQRANFTLITDHVKAASGTYAHTLVLKTDGSVYGMGANSSYQLGLPDKESINTPVKLTDDVIDVKAGYNLYSIILKKDGSVWSTGRNYAGQLGTMDNTDRSQFTKVETQAKAISAGTWHTMLLKNDNTLWLTGENPNGQLGIANKSNVNQFTKVADNVALIAAGGQYSIIMKTDGTFWATGSNAYGQLGIGTKADVSVFTRIKMPGE